MDNPPLLDIGGLIVTSETLRLERSRATALALARGGLQYARLLECRRGGEGNEETLLLEVDVQRPQRAVHDIRATEPIAITFFSDDRRPEVVSRRADFPHVPHLNLAVTEYPKSLCLDEQDWSELKAKWTPARFIERIRFWFAETARGTLHGDDQPLEPLIAGSGYQIVIPHDLFSRAEQTEVQALRVHLAHDKESRVLVAARSSGKEHGGVPFIAVALTAHPQTHGVIRKAPATLYELHQFLLAAGCDLLGKLRASADLWATDDTLKSRLAILAACPKRRAEGTSVEATDVWAFLTFKTVEDVLAAIGRRSRDGGYIIGEAMEHEQGQSIDVEVARTAFDLSRAFAAHLNGQDEASDLKIVAIGLGALGSKLQLSLARAGYGRWTLVDDDILLPHNLARHQYAGFWLGQYKAKVAQTANASLFDGEPPPDVIPSDVLRPGENAEKLAKALAEADCILDMSASVAVGRHLARVKSCARRISVFLNPSGTDLVLLAEDKGRTIPLDVLDLQFYRAIRSEPELHDHLTINTGRVRYALACRDITSRIPDDQVTLLAAIGARAVRSALERESAQIQVWKLRPDTFTVTSTRVATLPVHVEHLNDWNVVFDESIVGTLQALRQQKLPNETGGILLGSFDHETKRAYVIDTIASPPDSEEWPTLYIRGSEMLKEQLERAIHRTGGNLEYVGEWHSHPAGYSCEPSKDDIEVFTWLTAHMSDEGLPALMAIVGDAGPHFFLGQMIWKDG